MGRKKSKLSKTPRNRRRRIGLSIWKEYFLKEKLRQVAPSEPWVEAQIVTLEDSGPTGNLIQYRVFDPSVFPPGGEKTLMVRCPQCGILNPPNAFEHGACLDHANHTGWGPSPSARAIRKLQRYHCVEENPLVLEPEDDESLKREIEAWALHQGQTE